MCVAAAIVATADTVWLFLDLLLFRFSVPFPVSLLCKFVFLFVSQFHSFACGRSSVACDGFSFSLFSIKSSHNHHFDYSATMVLGLYVSMPPTIRPSLNKR